jgi:CRISPR system Cascade subunit CasE
MFFSLVTPDPANLRDAAHQQAYGSGLSPGNAYADHQWIWKLFPSPPGTPRDFLFRREVQSGLPRYYMVSQREPQAEDHAWRVLSRPYKPQLQAGMRLTFSLRANPVVAGHNEQGKHVRHDVVMQTKTKLLRERGLRHWNDWQGDDKPPLQALIFSACTAWLTAQAGRNGFEVVADSLSVDAYTQHRGKKAEIQFSTVDFGGELIVSDAAHLTAALCSGIGRAKAFGCGLLLVRPVS